MFFNMNRFEEILGRNVLLILLIAASTLNVAASTSNAQKGIPAFNSYQDIHYNKKDEKENVSKKSNKNDTEPKLRIYNKFGKWGVIDKSNNKIIVKPQFNEILPFNEGYAVVTKDGKKGVIKSDGKEYIKCKYEDILYPPSRILRSASTACFIVKDKGLWCLMNNKGAISKKFNSIAFSPDGVAYGELGNNEWIVISKDGNEGHIIYASQEEMAQHILPDKNILFNGEIYDQSGEILLVGDEKVKKVNLNDNQYLYSGNGLYCLNNFDECYLRKGNYTPTDSPDGLYRTVSTGKDIFINKSKIYFTYPFGIPIFKIIQDIKTGKKGLLSGSDSIVISPSFLDISLEKEAVEEEKSQSQKLSKACKRDAITLKVGKDSDQETISKECLLFVDKLRSLKQYNGIVNLVRGDTSRIWGRYNNYINIPAPKNVKVEYQHLLLVEYEDGLSAYDSQGNCIISRVTGVQPFTKNTYKVYKDNKLGLICFSDGKLEKTIEPQFDYIEEFGGLVGERAGTEERVYYLIMSKNGLKGLYTDYGDEILPCEFQKIEKLHLFLPATKEDLLKVTKDDLLGVITTNGDEILPCKYTQVYKKVLDDDAKLSIIVAEDINGNTAAFSPDGKPRPAFSNYSSFGYGGRVYKNGKMGFIDIETGKLLIPCIYDPDALQGGMEGPDNGSSTRIALGYEKGNLAIIDIWTLGGKKIGSRSFNRTAAYLMALYIEEMLGIEVVW